MHKNRIEAFSDGVFAIVITLLILDVRLPKMPVHQDADLQKALSATIPQILSYVFSFLVIGVFWIAHHRIFNLFKQVNHYLLWSNIFYLLTVALIPFPASVLAEHPYLPAAINFYSAVLLLVGIQHFQLLIYLYRHPDYQVEPLPRLQLLHFLGIAAVGPICYALAIISSFLWVYLSFTFIIGALLFYIFLLPFVSRIR